MRFLVTVLLLCFAIASAVPLNLENFEKELDEELENIFSSRTLRAKDELSLDEVKKQLKERFDDFVKKIKDAIEQGKHIKDETFKKLQELRQKLKDFNVGVDDKTKEFFRKIADGKFDVLMDIFDKLFPGHQDGEAFNADGDVDVDTLKNKFNELLQKVKDAFEQGKNIKDSLEMLQDLREKLKFLNIDLGDKAKEYLEKFKNKIKDYWNKLLEKLKSKRSVDTDIDVFGMLEELKQMIKDKISELKLKDFILKIFEKRSELRDQLMKFLEKSGEEKRQQLLDWIDRLLGKKDTKRSIKDVYEKIKTFFKDLNIDLKEKFVKFGEWVKERYEQGLEKGKDKLDNVKRIAKEFLKDTNNIRKDMVGEALEFFKEYKKDLGKIYDEIVDKAYEILKS